MGRLRTVSWTQMPRIGNRLSMRRVLAMEKLGLSEGSQDEELKICISENDACGLDAIQVITGCGWKRKSDFPHDRKRGIIPSIAERAENRFDWSFRRDDIEKTKMSKGRSGCSRFWVLQRKSCLSRKPTTLRALPEEAKIFGNVVCAKCGKRFQSRFKTGKRTGSLSGLLHFLP